MNFVWLLVLTCLASAGLAAGSTGAAKDLKRRSSSVDGPFAPRTLPDNRLFAPTTATAADPAPEGLKVQDHKDDHLFKSDIAEMGAGHYPVGFVDGKARLTNYAPKLEFYGIFINDEIVFVLDNFDVTYFGSSDAKSLLKLRMGDEDVCFQFFQNDREIQTDVQISSRKLVHAHLGLLNGQKLRIHLTKKNEIKIDGQELGKDLSITGSLPIVKTSKGNDAMKLTIDSSGMRDAAFDLQLETPFAESTAEVGTAGGLQTWHLGLMGAIVAGVIVAGLLVCSLCKKCPLHKKMCSKDKEPVVKATEPTKAGEKPIQPEEKNEKKMEKVTVAERLSVTRAKQTDAAPKKEDLPQTQPNTSARDGTKSISYIACKNDDGGYDGLDPNEGQENHSKKSQKQMGKDAKVVLKDGKLPGKKPSTEKTPENPKKMKPSEKDKKLGNEKVSKTVKKSSEKGQEVGEKKVSEEVKKPAEKASNEKGVDPTQDASQESKALGVKPKNSKNTTATLSIDASGTDDESVSGQEPKGAAEKTSSKSGKKKAKSTKEKSEKKLKKGNTQPTQVSTASVDGTQSNVTVDKTQDK